MINVLIGTMIMIMMMMIIIATKYTHAY